MISKPFFLKGFFFFLCIGMSLTAEEILINTFQGEMFILDVDPSESFGALKDKIVALSDGKEQSILIEIPQDSEIVMNYSAANQGGYLGFPRNYHEGVTAQEKADIHYIVTFLANKSLISIAMAKGELEAAGNRIDHVHPLRFLETVFTNEETKVGIRNIRGKGWVWNHFASGLKESLATEHNIGNVEMFIHHFADSVKIEVDNIHPLVNTQKWDDFIDVLIQKIPRNGDQDRYDCRPNFS